MDSFSNSLWREKLYIQNKQRYFTRIILRLFLLWTCCFLFNAFSILYKNCLLLFLVIFLFLWLILHFKLIGNLSQKTSKLNTFKRLCLVLSFITFEYCIEDKSVRQHIKFTGNIWTSLNVLQRIPERFQYASR